MSLLDVLNSLGAIALFVFGMKFMSDGIQRASGLRLRRFLNSMTRDKFRAMFAGLGLTSIIQSSSAVSVLTVSFVNAGLLNLLRAFAIIIGANIGTTITLWLVSFGFGIKLSQFCLPLIAFSIPFYLSKNEVRKGWAATIIGFSLIFLGLDFLETTLTALAEKPEFINYLNSLQGESYSYYLLFILIGLLATVILQSSSASTSIIVLLLTVDFPVELAAAMVIGANIGTTATAQIAATVGNVYAKMVAHFHTIFNIIGALIFFFFIGIVVHFIEKIIPTREHYYVLAAFHTIFNFVTALVVFPFLKWFVKWGTTRIRSKINTQNSFKVIHSSFSASPEMYIYEASKKLISFAGNIKQTTSNLGRLITESDEEKFQELHLRIKQLEDEGDQMEEDIIEYLNQLHDNDLPSKTSKKINRLMNVAQHLENIGDLAIKTSFTHKNRRESNSFITPKLRTHLIEIQDAVSTATTHLIQNLNEISLDNELTYVHTLEKNINTIHDNAMDALYEAIKKDKIKPLSAVYYRELIQNYEIIGDHIFKANKALVR